MRQKNKNNCTYLVVLLNSVILFKKKITTVHENIPQKFKKDIDLKTLSCFFVFAHLNFGNYLKLRKSSKKQKKKPSLLRNFSCKFR